MNDNNNNLEHSWDLQKEGVFDIPEIPKPNQSNFPVAPPLPQINKSEQPATTEPLPTNNGQPIDEFANVSKIKPAPQSSAQETELPKPIEPQGVTQSINQQVTEPITLPESSNLSNVTNKKFDITKEIIKSIGLFIGCFVFIYLFLTFPAYWAKAKYYWDKFTHRSSLTLQVPNSIEQNQGDILLTTLIDALEKSPDKQVSNKYSINIADLENNYLIIPKISVKAPIIWNVAPDEKLMLNKLQEGVIHYNGTALPDELVGNVFISGHSSYYWWDKGDYKTIFANLDKLESGDELALAYIDKVYIYKVIDKIIVKPEQTEVLNKTDKPIISLMTCVPVGTNLKRLIIKAERLQITNDDEQKEQEELNKIKEAQKEADNKVKISDTTTDQTNVETEKQKNNETNNIPMNNIEVTPIELLPWINN